MRSGKVPASAILLHGQSMAASEMPFEHVAAPAAVQANDIIAMNGLPDWDGGCPVHLGFDRRFTEANERLVNSRD